MDLFLSFAVWLVVAYSLRLAVLGSPTYMLVASVPYPVLAEAMECIDNEEPPENEMTFLFLRHYLLARLARLAVLWVEVSCIVYFLVTDFAFAVPLFLLIKLVAAWHVLYRPPVAEEQHVLEVIRHEPDWQRRWDRANHLVTAIGFAALFLRLHGWI